MKNILNNKQINKTLLTLAITGSMLASGTLIAGERNHHKSYKNGGGNSRVDYANVLKVRPITKTIEVSNPVERCWDKQVRNESYPRRAKHSHKNEIFGALIGAAVGNQVGKRSSGRNGRDIATAAGAVIGGVIGGDISKHKRQHRNQNSHVTYSTVKHCETEQRVSYEEKIVAYKVRYKYRGQVYNTRMNQHPGDRIKVRVSVTPIDYS
jgi:uncharacterized protein YcfJ